MSPRNIVAPNDSLRSVSARIPARFWLWLTGSGLSMLGVQLLGFAMAWVAAGHSATLAGFVLMSVNLPRTLLLLVGGAIADRHGAWRIMIAGDFAMVIVTGIFAAAAWTWGPRPALLLAAGLLIGTVDAFYLPASGSMPRRLLPPEHLTRGMSARQVVAQLGGVLGAPLGGVVVTAVGLAAAAALNSLTFAVMLALLLMIRPRGDGDRDAIAPGSPGVLAAAIEGLRLAATDHLLRSALVLVAGTAALLLPTLSLLLPVLARQHEWEATSTGLVAGAAGAATAVGALAIMMHNGFRSPGIAACSGLFLCAAGMATLAIATGGGVLAVVGGVLIGLGMALFTTHLGPLVLGATPPRHLARLQAVVALAQSLPLLVANAALGAAADAVGAAPMLLVTAIALVTLSAWALLATPLRTAARTSCDQPGPPESTTGH